MKRCKGFTLIELLVVVTIAAILASIALPAYRDSVRKAHRRAAQSAMMDIVNREQQYLVANRVFADKDTLGYGLPEDVADNYTYSIDVEDGPPPSFTIRFTPSGAQSPDGDLTLDSTGLKGPAGKW
jgi:type IV pilus assembly protein PilE